MQQNWMRDHFLGTALGLCVGEALGAQYEGLSASAVALRLGNNSLDMIGDERNWVARGEWTDDAGQFIAIMNSFNVCHGYDPLDVAGALGGWVKHNPKKLGMHSGGIIREIRQNLDLHHTLGREAWLESAGVRAGNGSLARCLVPGLFYHFDLELMIRGSIGCSQITHFDPRCVETALVLNFLLIQCLNKRFEAESLAHAVGFLEGIRHSDLYIELIQQFDPSVLLSYTNYTPFVGYLDDRDAVPNALKGMKQMTNSRLHNSGFCVHTLQVVCFALLHAKSFKEGLDMIVRLGGESDTNGAVGGALLGAKFGLANIPSDWRTSLAKAHLISSQAEKLLDTSMSVEEREYREGTLSL